MNFLLFKFNFNLKLEYFSFIISFYCFPYVASKLFGNLYNFFFLVKKMYFHYYFIIIAKIKIEFKFGDYDFYLVLNNYLILQF